MSQLEELVEVEADIRSGISPASCRQPGGDEAPLPLEPPLPSSLFPVETAKNQASQTTSTGAGMN